MADPDLQIRGGGGHPDPAIRGGWSQKVFFRPFGPQFGLKIRVPSPESATDKNVKGLPFVNERHIPRKGWLICQKWYRASTEFRRKKLIFALFFKRVVGRQWLLHHQPNKSKDSRDNRAITWSCAYRTPTGKFKTMISQGYNQTYPSGTLIWCQSVHCIAISLLTTDQNCFTRVGQLCSLQRQYENKLGTLDLVNVKSKLGGFSRDDNNPRIVQYPWNTPLCIR